MVECSVCLMQALKEHKKFTLDHFTFLLTNLNQSNSKYWTKVLAWWSVRNVSKASPDEQRHIIWPVVDYRCMSELRKIIQTWARSGEPPSYLVKSQIIIINSYYFKLLRFRVICNSVIFNWYIALVFSILFPKVECLCYIYYKQRNVYMQWKQILLSK